MPEAALQAFRVQTGNARRRRIPFLLTAAEFWGWWSTDGRWARRGRGRDALCMARRDDAGPYALYNIKPLTVAANSAETCRRKLSRASRAAWARRHMRGDFGHLGQGEHHPSSRACRTLFGRFGSGRLAADMLGLRYAELRRRLKRREPGWAWEDED